MSATIQQALQKGREALAQAGLVEGKWECEFILSDVLHQDRAFLYLHSDQNLSDQEVQLYWDQIHRRAEFEPVAYIQKKKVFYGREFYVDPRVLIPRPETELLVEAALSLKGPQKVLDVGTGSGCVAISLALENPNLEIWATDVSKDALEVARLNAQTHGVLHRLQFVETDLYQAFGQDKQGYFDIIVANPPYISTAEMKTVEPDLAFEPLLALHGGEEGLSVLNSLIQSSPTYLRHKGFLLLEIGYRQGDPVKACFERVGFSGVGVLKDFSHHDRVVKGQWNG